MIRAASEHKLYGVVCAQRWYQTHFITQRFSRPGFLNLKIWSLWLWLLFSISYQLLSWGFSPGKDPHGFLQHLLPFLREKVALTNTIFTKTCLRVPEQKNLFRTSICVHIYCLRQSVTLALLLGKSCWSQDRCSAAHPVSRCPGSSLWFCLPMFSFSIWQVSSPLSFLIFKCLTALTP